MEILVLLTFMIFCLLALGLYQLYMLRQIKKDVERTGLKVGLKTGEGQPMTTGGLIAILLFLLVFVVIGYFSIKMTMARYDLANKALASGNGQLAMAALAPEIGSGIGSIFRR